MVSGDGIACTAPGASATPVPEMEYNAYIAERTAKTSLFEKQSEFLDKSLLTLAGGALGLTLAFLHDNDRAQAGVWLVAVGMTSLVVSILSVLFSLLSSQRSISLRIDALDAWCRVDFVAGHPSEHGVTKSMWASITAQANIISTLALMAGLICISSFVAFNLFLTSGDIHAMNNSNKPISNTSQSVPFTKGAVIKPPPVQQPSQSTNSSNQGGKK